MLISWTRILSGRFTDPQGGRDLLADCLASIFTIIINNLITIALTTWFNVSGISPSYPSGHDSAIRGWAGEFGMVAHCLLLALVFAFAVVVILLMARLIARRQWLTISLCIVMYGFGGLPFMGESPIIAIPGEVVVSAALIFVLFRFGLVGMTATHITNLLIGFGLLTADPSR